MITNEYFVLQHSEYISFHSDTTHENKKSIHILKSLIFKKELLKRAPENLSPEFIALETRQSEAITSKFETSLLSYRKVSIVPLLPRAENGNLSLINYVKLLSVHKTGIV